MGRLWYDTPDHAIGYAMHSSRSHDDVIRVYDAAGNVIETQEHRGSLKEPRNILDLVLWHPQLADDDAAIKLSEKGNLSYLAIIE